MDIQKKIKEQGIEKTVSEICSLPIDHHITQCLQRTTAGSWQTGNKPAAEEGKSSLPLFFMKNVTNWDIFRAGDSPHNLACPFISSEFSSKSPFFPSKYDRTMV